MKRKGKRKMWIVIGVVAGLIVLFLIGAILCNVFTAKERREARDLPIGVIDFKELSDGTYMGEYEGGMYKLRAAKVQVTVSSGRVTDIELLKGALNKEGQPAELNAKGLSIKDLFGRVINSQSLQVDAISGATLTSKAHLKAVENALEQAQ